MVIVKLSDGTGNQLFQYAMGRRLAMRLGTTMKLDVRSYARDRKRKYDLDQFNITAGLLSKAAVKVMGSRLVHSPRYAWLQALLRWVDSGLVAPEFEDVEQGFDARVNAIQGSVVMKGFWQNEGYFKDIREILLREFTFRAAPSAESARCMAAMDAVNSVCLHVRRGDYAADPIVTAQHGLCSLDYYRNAVAYMAERVEQPHYFVFSDDPAWVRENLMLSAPMTLVTHNTGANDTEDLRLMMRCKHFVVANSSFSWWGAWLGQWPGKIVVAPKVWFRAERLRWNDPAPEDWVRM